MRLPLVALTFLATLASCAKIVVVPVNEDNRVDREGIFYALPKTVVRTQIKVDRSKVKQAPYMIFAGIFAPEAEPVCDPAYDAEPSAACSDSPEYGVQKASAVLTSYGEPDPDNIYMVKFIGFGAQDQTMSMTWNDMGIPATVGASTTNRALDVAIATTKLGATLAGKAMGGGELGFASHTPRCPIPSASDKWVIGILESSDEPLVPREVLVANYCDMKKEKRDALSHHEENRELLRQALAAFALRVVPLMRTRQSLFIGTALSPEPLITKVDTAITQQLQNLYLGSKTTVTWEGSIDVRTLNPGATTPILKIDRSKGFCVAQGASRAPDAKPFPKEMTILEGDDCNQGTPVNLALDYYPPKTDQLFYSVQSYTKEDCGEQSFRYRIPAQVVAKVRDEKQEYGTAVMSVAQLGTTVALPAKRNTKMISYDLGFVEATGGLKSFKLGATGVIDAAAIDGVSTAAGTVLDARNAAAKDKREANDELTILTREAAILEQQDKICTVRTKYGLECDDFKK